MSIEVRRHRAAEEAVTDACEFLEVTRPEFFDLAEAWEQVGPALWQSCTPATFYTSWRGDAGKSAVAANVMDQFSRGEIFEMLGIVFDRLDQVIYLDFGCGTGAVSYPYLHRALSAVMIDVPNANQDYLRWRLVRAGLNEVALLEPNTLPQLPDATFNLIACIDVLEHLTNPTEVFAQLDRVLRIGGLFLFRAPWARDNEDFGEHLPEATRDWHRPGGGGQILQLGYQLVGQVTHGGLYQKQR